MGNPFSKDGSITKIAEVLPGGGIVTGIAHAAAGNPIHAAQAAIAGFGTLAGTVVAGPIGGYLVAAGTQGLSSIFDELGLSDDKKEEAAVALNAGDSDTAARILVEAGQEKIAVEATALSAKAGGRRSLRSFHGTYLRAVEPDKPISSVDMVSGSAGECENWYIEDWGGKVVLKGRGAPNKQGQFLCAYSNFTVNLIPDHPNNEAGEMWKPMKNTDGSWSLLSVYGTWLSARADGSVCTTAKCDDGEHFWLEYW